MRKDAKRRLRNRSTISALRTLIKKIRAAITAGDEATMVTLQNLVNRRFDQAAAKDVIHKNAASRMKSRINARIVKAKAAKAAATPAAATTTT